MTKYNVLVIDDDPNIRKLLGELLAGHPEYRVLIASDGKEAVRQLVSERIHVVLTDIHMPGFTGLELMADMQKVKISPEILVMTANATPENVEMARKIGARSVILKPFDNLDIVEGEIDKAVRAAAAATAVVDGTVAPSSAPSKKSAPASPAPAAAARPATAAKPAGAPKPTHAAPPARAARPAPEPVIEEEPGDTDAPIPDYDAWKSALVGNETPDASPDGARAAAPAAARIKGAPPQASRQAQPKPPAAASRPAAPPEPAAPVFKVAATAPPAPKAAPAARTPASPPAAPVAPPAAPAAARARPPAPARAAAPPAPPEEEEAADDGVAIVDEVVEETEQDGLTSERVPQIPSELVDIFQMVANFDFGKMKMQVPIVCLQTWEEKGAIAALRRMAASLRRDFCVWSAATGLAKEGQNLGEMYKEPGRMLEFIRRQKTAGLYVLADFRQCLEDRTVVRVLREMVMEMETARSFLVLTAPRLAVPPELSAACATFDWPADGGADMDSVYEEVMAEVSASSGRPIRLSREARQELFERVRELPSGRARFEIARALMSMAKRAS